MSELKAILQQDVFSPEDLRRMLEADSAGDRDRIFATAAAIRKKYVGNKFYLRGLVEYSNVCRKNCLYCGIRASNRAVVRYTISREVVLNCVRHALEMGYGSVVIQSGEVTGAPFVDGIEHLLRDIDNLSGGSLGITLSCGEQSLDTYQRWFDAGAHRYLLRFESASQELYGRIHPADNLHAFSNRLRALNDLREVGYQLGSGMMIGLPGQTMENLVGDLLLLKELDVDMVGMGPYIGHPDTPLYADSHLAGSPATRLELSLRMIAVLRIMMKDINIAASTALDSLDPSGREQAIAAGANVLMPNLTPVNYRENYFLYTNKPYLTEADELMERFQNSAILQGFAIGYRERGDSKHYAARS